MADITKGVTFANTVTAGGVHTMVESATIANIDRASMRSTEIVLASRSSSAPSSPAAREVWQTQYGGGLLSYDSTNSRFTPAIPRVVRFHADPTGGTITAGQAVMSSGHISATLDTPYFVVASGAGTAKVAGIALSNVAAGSDGYMVVGGPAYAACTGTVAAGQAMKLSSTDGTLQSVAMGAGAGWEFIGTALGSDSGGFVWLNLRR